LSCVPNGYAIALVDFRRIESDIVCIPLYFFSMLCLVEDRWLMQQDFPGVAVIGNKDHRSHMCCNQHDQLVQDPSLHLASDDWSISLCCHWNIHGSSGTTHCLRHCEWNPE
jgi:hypothetical protein